MQTHTRVLAKRLLMLSFSLLCTMCLVSCSDGGGGSSGDAVSEDTADNVISDLLDSGAVVYSYSYTYDATNYYTASGDYLFYSDNDTIMICVANGTSTTQELKAGTYYIWDDDEYKYVEYTEDGIQTREAEGYTAYFFAFYEDGTFEYYESYGEEREGYSYTSTSTKLKGSLDNSATSLNTTGDTTGTVLRVRDWYVSDNGIGNLVDWDSDSYGDAGITFTLSGDILTVTCNDTTGILFSSILWWSAYPDYYILSLAESE